MSDISGKLNIFISWSKEQSRELAGCLNDFLNKMFENITTFYSPESIDTGSQWLTNVSGALNQCTYGILVVTPENLVSPWLIFEAGALSKQIDTARVCPLLFNLKKSQLEGPLTQFQSIVFEKDEVYKLVKSINDQLASSMKDDRLAALFSVFWPDFTNSVRAILEKPAPNTPVVEKRTPDDILEELLDRVRQIQSRVENNPTPDPIIKDDRIAGLQGGLLEQNTDEIMSILIDTFSDKDIKVTKGSREYVFSVGDIDVPQLSISTIKSRSPRSMAAAIASHVLQRQKMALQSN